MADIYQASPSADPGLNVVINSDLRSSLILDKHWWETLDKHQENHFAPSMKKILDVLWPTVATGGTASERKVEVHAVKEHATCVHTCTCRGLEGCS